MGIRANAVPLQAAQEAVQAAGKLICPPLVAQVRCDDTASQVHANRLRLAAEQQRPRRAAWSTPATLVSLTNCPTPPRHARRARWHRRQFAVDEAAVRQL